MKSTLTLLTVSCLIGAMLYPLLFMGAGHELNWLIEAGLLLFGLSGLYLLIKFRKSL